MILISFSLALQRLNQLILDMGRLSDLRQRSGAKDMNAKATVVRATPVPRMFVAEGVVVATTPEVREQVVRAVSEQFAHIEKEAKAANVPCETLHVEDDKPSQAILEAAKQKGCDLIVMASHGRTGFSAAFLGSATQKVLAQSSIPVLVCR